jgi:hypothetical protein
VCSSRLDPATGEVTVTTPGAGYEVGLRLAVVGSAAEFARRATDNRLERLLASREPLALTAGRQQPDRVA